jgi:2-hydroxychromene-2-carboxylate isomerase
MWRKQVTKNIESTCAATYLAWPRLPKLAAQYGATLDYRPVLLGGIFKAIGNHAPTEIPSKATWLRQDLERCAQRHGIQSGFSCRPTN